MTALIVFASPLFFNCSVGQLGSRATVLEFDRKLLIALIFRFLRFSYGHPRQESGRAHFRIGAD